MEGILETLARHDLAALEMVTKPDRNTGEMSEYVAGTRCGPSTIMETAAAGNSRAEPSGNSYHKEHVMTRRSPPTLVALTLLVKPRRTPGG